MQLKKATRKQVKLKLGLSGASGFGKTYSALKIAHGLVGDWSKIAVIDTENSSASLYSHLGEFNTLDLAAPFSPERYIEAINTCVNAGMEVVIIDSISHEWEGKGGCLEIVDSLGGKYQDWGKVTPRHQAFIGAILQAPVHVITTVRRKQDYDMVKDGNRVKVEKVGTREVTREGFEYELTLALELVNDKHLAKASKDRTGMFSNKPEFVISEETGKLIKQWCETGELLPPVEPSFKITDHQLIELESLLDNCTLEPENNHRKVVEMHLRKPEMFTQEKYMRIKTMLQGCQKNPVTEQGNPSARQLNEFLADKVADPAA